MEETIKETINRINSETTEKLKIIDTEKKFHHKKISISRIKENMYEPFDKEKQSERCSQKYMNDKNSKYFGMTPEQIEVMWDQKAEKGKERGKCIDQYEEYYFSGQDKWKQLFRIDHPDMRQKFDAIEKVLASLAKVGMVFQAREMPVVDLYQYKNTIYEISGRFDVLYGYQDFLVLFDNKNDTEIPFDNHFQKCLGPMHEFDSCKWNLYTLQLEIYKQILVERYGQNSEKIITYICNFPSMENPVYKLIKTNPALALTHQRYKSILDFVIQKEEIKEQIKNEGNEAM